MRALCQRICMRRLLSKHVPAQVGGVDEIGRFEGTSGPSADDLGALTENEISSSCRRQPSHPDPPKNFHQARWPRVPT
jgi:hypothetical protein